MRRRVSISPPALPRLGIIEPLPLVGRAQEIAAIEHGLATDCAADRVTDRVTDRVADRLTHHVVVLRGPAGSGKSRLAEHVLRHALPMVRRRALVRCLPGDSAAALGARAERALGLLPGALPDRALSERFSSERALSERLSPERLSPEWLLPEWLLIVDDLHHLDDTQAHIFAALAATRRGRWLLLSRHALPGPLGDPARVIELAGLTEPEARDLWHSLEIAYGPCQHDACDRALERVGGLPLQLLRAYSQAITGHDPWDAIDRLPEDLMSVLTVLSVLRLPATSDAVVAILERAQAGYQIDRPADHQIDHPAQASDAAFAALAAWQLIEPAPEPAQANSYRVHDCIRQRVVAATNGERRARIELAISAVLLQDLGPRDEPGALIGHDLADPVMRLREAAHHALGANRPDLALAIICDHADTCLGRGAHDEVRDVLDRLAAHPFAHQFAHQFNGPRRIATLRARIAARHGRVAEALELSMSSDAISDAISDPISDPATDPICDPTDTALLCYRAGDVAGARRRLRAVLDADSADARARAAAALAELELVCGAPDIAESLVNSVLERERGALGNTARAHLHLALAAIEEHAGRLATARAWLSRAAGQGALDLALAAHIEARRARCLLAEGRAHEAAVALAEAERMALEVDATAVADDIRLVRSSLARYRGDALQATETLHELVTRRRRHGDEMGALAAEIDLARAHIERGVLLPAAELLSAAAASCARRKLLGLSADIQLLGAMLDMHEMRAGSARVELEGVLAAPASRADTRAHAAMLLAEVLAWQGQPASEQPASAHPEHAGHAEHPGHAGHDSLRASWIRARTTHARGDIEGALSQARTVAAHAQRAGRRGQLVDALSLCARLSFARGDRASARAEATRALHEANAHGLVHAQTQAHLVLAALARHHGDTDAALSHARTAGELAVSAGLPIARLVAAEACDAIDTAIRAADRTVDHSADRGPDHTIGRSAGHVSTQATRADSHAARATMSPAAQDAAVLMLSDLGLTATRPFRVISAGGAQSFVPDADPERLQLAERALAIDAVRELIVRRGADPVDLRRRVLLKRMIYLLAGAPGRIFSKEQIVETVWQVAYHPLRHDAALFTNIMRVRRLLGPDGAELLRMYEDGYRFLPPRDYLFVELVADNNAGDDDDD